MDRILEAAKAIVAAAVAAAIADLAGVDWQAVNGAAVASGGLTFGVPNKKRKH